MSSPKEIFTIKFWKEILDNQRGEWRGRVQHLSSGQSRYFKDSNKLIEFISDRLSGSGEGEQLSQPDPGPGRVSKDFPSRRYPLRKKKNRNTYSRTMPSLSNAEPHNPAEGVNHFSPGTEGDGKIKRILARIKLVDLSGKSPIEKLPRGATVLLFSIALVIGIALLKGSWRSLEPNQLLINPNTIFLSLLGLSRRVIPRKG